MFAKLAGQPKREYLHAEIAALLRAPADADTLLVVRTNKQGEFVCAKPCPVCALAIAHFNANLRVEYT
jgi:tRNA(Arg) A34 adenosine deaminase TadA